jgi:hypothetical protein
MPLFLAHPALGMRGATWFLGVSEWTFGTLLFLIWNKKLGILGRSDQPPPSSARPQSSVHA